MAGLTNFDNVVDMDFLHLRILTMIKLLKWQSHGSVYVNVIRKSNNSANNSSNGIPTKYRLEPWFHVSHRRSAWIKKLIKRKFFGAATFL